MKQPPNSRRNLDLAIQRISGRGDRYIHMRTMIANAIAAHLLPNSAIKGGSALKMRFGDAATRFTTDLDAAALDEPEAFLDALEMNLREGWHGFTGHVVVRQPPCSDGVPDEYVMQPYDVKLSFKGKPWVTVPLEVGHNEIGDAGDPDMIVAESALTVLKDLGFPELDPLPLMRIDHQIAQKIHALSASGSGRAHDLVDLQLIFQRCSIDLPRTRETCIRLFAYRNAHEWPPRIALGEDWGGIYAAQTAGLEVLRTADEAVAWANSMIERIDTAR